MADDQPEPQAAAKNFGQRAEVGLPDEILLWQRGKSALNEPRTLAQFQLSLPFCHDPPRGCEAVPPAKPGEGQIFTRTAPPASASLPRPTLSLDQPSLGLSDCLALAGPDGVRLPLSILAYLQAGAAKGFARHAFCRKSHQHPGSILACLDDSRPPVIRVPARWLGNYRNAQRIFPNRTVTP